MKKFLMTACIALLAFAGCEKGGDEVEYNKFTVDGTGYETVSGMITAYGDYYTGDTENFELQLFTDDSSRLQFDMLSPDGSDRLAAGKYTFVDGEPENEYTFGTWESNSGAADSDDNWLYVTGGTVEVSVSGTGDDAVYTITVNCQLKDGYGDPAGSVKGTYRGTLDLGVS